jgi:hypothetical protein
MIRHQWPCSLRRGSGAAGLLGLRVRIPSGERMSVSCECWVLSGRISGSNWSLVQRSPTECGVSECDREVSILRRPWPRLSHKKSGLWDLRSESPFYPICITRVDGLDSVFYNHKVHDETASPFTRVHAFHTQYRTSYLSSGKVAGL